MYLQASEVWDGELTRKADIFLFGEILLALQGGTIDPFKGAKSGTSFLHKQIRIWDSWKANILGYALPLLKELATAGWQQTPEELRNYSIRYLITILRLLKRIVRDFGLSATCGTGILIQFRDLHSMAF
jgi:hypothetical protein